MFKFDPAAGVIVNAPLDVRELPDKFKVINPIIPDKHKDNAPILAIL